MDFDWSCYEIIGLAAFFAWVSVFKVLYFPIFPLQLQAIATVDLDNDRLIQLVPESWVTWVMIRQAATL